MAYALGEFLVHAVAMEREAAERYLELADMMEAHNNLEVSRVFRDMHRYSTMHGDSIAGPSARGSCRSFARGSTAGSRRPRSATRMASTTG